MSGPDKLERRSNYKAVWSALSKDETAAKVHVAGTEDEAELKGSGIGTTKFLLENVGMGRSDVVRDRLRDWSRGPGAGAALSKMDRLRCVGQNVEPRGGKIARVSECGA